MRAGSPTRPLALLLVPALLGLGACGHYQADENTTGLIGGGLATAVAVGLPGAPLYGYVAGSTAAGYYNETRNLKGRCREIHECAFKQTHQPAWGGY